MNNDIEDILKKYPSNKKEDLIPLLQEIAGRQGHLSGETLDQVSLHMNIPVNKIYGVATFYDQFRFASKGVYHFQVCAGTSCHLEGGVTIQSRLEELLQIKPGQISRNGRFSMETVSCFGACSKTPVVAVNGQFYTNVTKEFLSRFIESLIVKKN